MVFCLPNAESFLSIYGSTQCGEYEPISLQIVNNNLFSNAVLAVEADRKVCIKLKCAIFYLLSNRKIFDVFREKRTTIYFLL